MPHLSLSEFADRVSELMPYIMKEFMKSQATEFYKLKMTMPQFFVLEFLGRLGECTMGGLAKHLNVTTAAMTGVVERLVRDGYVLRSSDPQDRRIVRIKPTAKGSKVVRDMIQKRKEISIRIFGMISQEEREQYLKILTHLKEHLKD